MQFSNSNKEVTIDGKVYKVCDACGAKQRNNFGFDIDYQRKGVYGGRRMGLCIKCANRIIPIMEKAIDVATALEQEIKETAQRQLE